MNSSDLKMQPWQSAPWAFSHELRCASLPHGLARRAVDVIGLTMNAAVMSAGRALGRLSFSPSDESHSSSCASPAQAAHSRSAGARKRWRSADAQESHEAVRPSLSGINL